MEVFLDLETEKNNFMVFYELTNYSFPFFFGGGVGWGGCLGIWLGRIRNKVS